MGVIIIDNITIILGITILLSAFVTPFINCFFRKPETVAEADTVEDAERNDSITPKLPKISILLTPHENGRELEQNLPLYLNQDYPEDFEVIVVMWKGDAETEDALKRFEGNQHLYTTYIPDSSRYMSRKKLGITLGVKAAKHEWIMLTDIECKPNSPQWLATMARNCQDDKQLVIGYTAYENETPPYRRFERLHTAMYLIREDQKGTPYRHNGCNLLFRKSMFIAQDGFRGNLKFIRGEYDFMVNKYATKTNTATELHPDSWMTEQMPTEKQWRNKHLFYMESRKHLQRSLSHRLLFNLDQWALHLNYILFLAVLAYSIITQRWILTGIAAIALIITTCFRSAIGKKATNLFGETFSGWQILLFEIGIVWHNIGYLLKYRRADKYDFICHKI